MSEHLFGNDEIGILFTGTNALEVSQFLGGTHFEFRDTFTIPVFGGDDVIVESRQWLVKNTVTGTFRAVDDNSVQFGSEVPKPKKTRKTKKDSK